MLRIEGGSSQNEDPPAPDTSDDEQRAGHEHQEEEEEEYEEEEKYEEEEEEDWPAPDHINVKDVLGAPFLMGRLESEKLRYRQLKVELGRLRGPRLEQCTRLTVLERNEIILVQHKGKLRRGKITKATEPVSSTKIYYFKIIKRIAVILNMFCFFFKFKLG